MKVRYRSNPALPGLAWVARLEWSAGLLSIEHGPLVETAPGCWFEGAWAGDFAAGRPDQTEVAFGSGGVVLGDEVCFVASLATTDYLYYRADGQGVRVANSLALLLAELGDRLDPGCRRYDAINNTILRGVAGYERELPTRDGSVRRLLHRNLRCAAGRVSEAAKPDAPEFPGFAEYAQYLRASYAALARNARDPRRAHPLRIYSTQSRGYDTTAINAIAAEHGLDGVFTVTRGKGNPGRPDVDDDGSDIARRLGLGAVIPLDRHSYREGFADELYYHAAIHECQDANLKQVVDHIVGPALLLTGTLGEIWYTHTCWYRHYPETMHDGLARGDLGTHGLGEVRLRAGYVQAALPYIGGRRRAAILAITESEELRPWRLETQYDRPIARRLGESAGIPREAFGQLKIGSVVEGPLPQAPREPGLRQRFVRFLREARARPGWQLRFLTQVQRFNARVALLWWKHYKIVYYPLRAFTRLFKRPEPKPPVIWRDLRGSLFCFAVNETAAEYAAALDSPGSAALPPHAEHRGEVLAREG